MEVVFEIIFGGFLELALSSKIPKWIRLPFAIIAMGLIQFVLIFMAITVVKKNLYVGIFVSIFPVAWFAFFIFLIYKIITTKNDTK